MHEVNPIARYIQKLKSDQEAYGLTVVPPRNSLISNERYNKLNASELAENWCIGPIKAMATLRTITQQFKRSAILPISRRYTELTGFMI